MPPASGPNSSRENKSNKEKKKKKLRNEAIAHLSELRIKIIIILVTRVIQY